MRLFFEPRSVVLIGVSRQSGVGAYNNLEVMLRYGYRGQIFVVHPKIKELLGLKTHPSVKALPVAPDVAVISLGRDRVLPVFTECLEKGIKRFVIISQGFADADDRGKELQMEIAQRARGARARVVGPNTMGVVNPFNGFTTSFADIVKDPSPPPLSLVVQSGVFQVGYESFTGRMGKAIDIGNACDVDFVDLLDYLENDAETRFIVLHMEGMKRGEEFLEAASRISRHKPIVALKTGRSSAGARAVLSHTGSLVGEDAVLDVAFARAGVLRVRNMVELRAVCKAFLSFPSVDGPRLGVVTATGACGIMTADACEEYGLELAPFPEAMRSALDNPHIAWHHLNNPVDIWPLGMVSGSFMEVLKKAVMGLFADEKVDAVLAISPAMSSPLHRDLDIASAVRDIHRSCPNQKPLALWLYGGDQFRQSELLANEPNVACFSSMDEAIMGLSAMHRYRKLQKRPVEVHSSRVGYAPSAGSPSRSLRGGVILGNAAWNIIKEYGISAVPGEPARDEARAAEIADRIGYPVVLKIISPQWIHKSDWGGVRLNLDSEEHLLLAYGELQNLFRERTPAGKLEGILVQKQAIGTELILGIKKDPQFGPVLLVGMGGIYAEVFKDVARTLLPVSREDVEALIESLHIYPVLRGIRGRQGAHLQALVENILALARLAQEHPEIVELDLNPVVANPGGCWCVDCRIVAE